LFGRFVDGNPRALGAATRSSNACAATPTCNASTTAPLTPTLADLIASLTGRPVAYTVAAIILKRGLHWLCG
jgi:type IV secretory pathway VirB2 component (pilin)